MDEYARQHDPDQIVLPSETGPSEGAQPPQARDDPGTAERRGETECRDIECPRQLAPAPPAATAPPGATARQPVLAPPRQGFWGSLTEIERADLLACAEEIVYPVGTVLWFEGQVADQALVIRSGSIRVSVERDGRERIIAFRRPGDIVGERAALLLRQRSATIVAMDTVHGLRVTTQQFVTYLSDHPRVVAVMEREVYDRLTEQNAQAPQTPPSYAHASAAMPAQPYGVAEPPHGVAEPPHGATAAPYGTAERPHGVAAAPHGTVEQPYGVTAQPYRTVTQPYGTVTQPYSAGTMPLTYPQMGHVPYPAAAGGSARTVPSASGGSWPVHPVADAPVPSHAQPTQPMAVTPPGPPGPPGPAGPSLAGQNCTILYTDIAGFSASHRNDADRLDMRHAMYAVLREAFEESRVPWASCYTEDRGDGALIVVPPEVPTAAVIDPMLAALAVRLRRHNRRSSGAVRIQLRVAVGVGPVLPDPPGVTGFALIHTARLLDAPPLKERLAVTGADLGFIASQFVYESVIAHGAGYVNPAEYEPISCRVKKLETEGWIHLRGVPARSAV